jgi:hypothetical protein
MFKKASKKVTSGDQFVELDKTSSIWEVVGIVDNPHLPPHARIRELGEEDIHLTSVSALLDEAFYRPTENREGSTSEPQNNTDDRIDSLFGKQVSNVSAQGTE